MRWDSIHFHYRFLYHDDGRQLGRVYEGMLTNQRSKKGWYWNDFTSDRPYLVSAPCATREEAENMLYASLVTSKLENA